MYELTKRLLGKSTPPKKSKETTGKTSENRGTEMQIGDRIFWPARPSIENNRPRLSRDYPRRNMLSSRLTL
jgi:hypothetical protein